MKREKLKIVSMIFNCVLSLFAMFSLTFSWFAYNDKANGSGLDISVEKTAYTEGDPVYYLRNADDGYVFTKTETKSLGTYDLLNDRYQLIIKLKIVDGIDKITIAAKTDTTYFLGDGKHPLLADTSVDETLESGEKYNNALSSVISMGVLTSSDFSGTPTDDGFALSALPDENRLSVFIENNAMKSSPVYITADAATTTTATVVGTNGAVYIYFSYDPVLIASIFSANIGNTNIESLEKVQLLCDFSIVIDKAE